MQTLNRRQFTTRSLSFLAALPLLGSVGCSFSSVYADILKYVPVALSAFSSIISILAGAGDIGSPLAPAIAAVIAQVNKGFADLQTAVNAYDAAPSSQKSTVVGEISTALKVVESYLQAFWNSLTLPDPQMASLVEGLLGVITSTLLGFATQLPVPTVPSAVTSMRANLTRTITAAPQKRSIKKFRSDFNALLKGTAYQGHSI